MNFSLVIPCFNEEKNIPILIKKYKKYLSYSGNELILVNNGSKDNTEKVLKKFSKFKNIKTCKVNKNIGFGYGLKKGFSIARGDIIIYSHADLEVDPKDIIRSIKLFKNDKNRKNLFVKGNRINKIKNHWTYLDIFLSYALTIVATVLFRKKLFDIHGMPVLFSKKLQKKIKYFPNDFSIDLAIYAFAKKEGFKIVRFPVNFNKKRRKHGEGSSDSLQKKIKGSIDQFYQSLVILLKLN